MSDIENILNTCFQSKQTKTSEGLSVKVRLINALHVRKNSTAVGNEHEKHPGDLWATAHRTDTHSSCFTPYARVHTPTNWRMVCLAFWCVVSTVRLLYFQCRAAGEGQYTHTMKLPVNDSDYYCWDPLSFRLLSKSQFQVGLRFPKPLSWAEEDNQPTETTGKSSFLSFSDKQNSKWGHCSVQKALCRDLPGTT